MKHYLNHKEVTPEEFERSRLKSFDGCSQWSVELEEGEYEVYDSWEGTWREFVTLTLCGALIVAGLYWLWEYLTTLPL